MILYCNYEELTALNQGARAFLDEDSWEERGVAATTPSREAVQALVPQLEGDVSIETLQEQRKIQSAVEVIVDQLREELETRVVTTHAADEEAVAAYFDFAHALSVLERVREIGDEMRALIEVMTGDEPTADLEREFRFPD